MGQGVRNGPELTAWTIEKLVPGGAGLARLEDGRVGFVAGAFPGERVRPLAIETARDFVRASAFELIAASPERVEPPCPVVDACGGCDWMRLELDAQRRHKVLLVVQAFARTGGIELEASPDLVSAGEGLGFRSRVRLHLAEDGTPGFFARQTRRLVPIAECAVASPGVNAALRALTRLEPKWRAELGRACEALELRAESDHAFELTWVPRRESRSWTPSAQLLEALGALGAVVHGPDDPRGSPRVPLPRLPLPGGVFAYAPPGGFTQVNPAVNARLVEAVLAGAAERSARRFLDLFAGNGNFSLPLAAAGLSGIAVEAERVAARAAGQAAREQGLRGLGVRQEQAAHALRALVGKGERFDLVTLDPPRAGAKECLADLVRLGPPAIGYVACDPVTLARDAKTLVSTGYRLSSVKCFDMFPQTHHVETLAWFERSGRA